MRKSVFAWSLLILIAWSARLPAASTVPADAALAEFFETYFTDTVTQSPEYGAYLGNDFAPGQWTDYSLGGRASRLAHQLGWLERLERFIAGRELGETDQLSVDLLRQKIVDDVEAFRWRDYDYPVNQMRGRHTSLITFLANYHKVRTAEDAENYLERLDGLPEQIAQVEIDIAAAESAGVMPPKFVFPLVLQACRNIISGDPFEGEGTSPVLEDFQRKLDGLEELPADRREALLQEARTVLTEEVGSAYRSLIATLEDQSARATNEAGVWKFPHGAEYYAYRLREMTTTDLSPEEIHQLGLEETRVIHAAMREIMARVGFDGSLGDFFTFMREDDRFYLPNTPEGKESYLETARAYVEAFRPRLPEIFNRMPRAELEVRAVEAYRESSAGKAFYSRPAIDGSRPGYYYVNLKDTRIMPLYQLEALTAHEAIPGHHMQIAIAQELEGIPTFRRHLRFTAYSEGWGLYSELLPAELGFYEDPYSDFGRLALQLWRAARLVVDTGLHHHRWTREQAIDWLVTNTPNPEGDCRDAINRYIVYPGQATAYMVGRMKIQELRQRAEEALGERFDLAAFHDIVLQNGPLPLDVLEAQVDAYIARQRSS